MDNPSLEIKQELDDDLNSSDLLEITKQEEYLIFEDPETEVKERSSLLGVAGQNKLETKQPEINREELKDKVYYAVLNNIYRCTLCPFGTRKLNKIRTHFHTHNYSRSRVSESPYKIDAKELSIMLKDHLYEYCVTGSVALFHCKLCEFKWPVHDMIKRHVNKCHIKVTNRCRVCNKIFLTARMLRLHQRMHNTTTRQLYKCTKCEFTSSKSLTKHMKIHINEKIFNCNLCIYKTCLRKCWKGHIKSHSRVNEKPRPIIVPKEAQYVYVGSEKKFQCNLCKYKCLIQQTVKTHVYTKHTHIKLPRCQLCDKSFVTKRELKIHLRVHFKEFDEYSECDNTSSEPLTKDNLENHTNRDFERDFKCSEPLTKDVEIHAFRGFECDFTSSETLTKNMELQKNGGFERDFTCSEPLKIKMETIENIYYCNLCSYKCELMSSWQDHKILCNSNENACLIPTLKEAQYVYEHDEKPFLT